MCVLVKPEGQCHSLLLMTSGITQLVSIQPNSPSRTGWLVPAAACEWFLAFTDFLSTPGTAWDTAKGTNQKHAGVGAISVSDCVSVQEFVP